jgi:DNA-binding CsgD family transcriptional regulator
VFDAIAVAERARTHDELAAAFSGLFARLGVEMCVVFRTCLGPEGAVVTPLFGRRLPGWSLQYRVREYARIDPIVAAAMSSAEPQYWTEAIARLILTPEQQAMIADAATFGLLEGVTLCVGPVDGGMLMTALAGRHVPTVGLKERVALQVCGYYYGLIGLRLQFVEDEPLPPSLSPRQIECLGWAAVGKSSAEIGVILGLSTRTVEHYVALACGKLGVHSRFQAIIQARSLGMLPSSLR